MQAKHYLSFLAGVGLNQAVDTRSVITQLYNRLNQAVPDTLPWLQPKEKTMAEKDMIFSFTEDTENVMTPTGGWMYKISTTYTFAA